MTGESKNGNPFDLLPMNAQEYYGSGHILHQALQAIGGRYPNNLQLIGLPGMGKTFLLRYLALPETLKQHSTAFAEPYRSHPYLLLPLLIDFRGDLKSDRIADTLYQRIWAAYHTYSQMNQEPLRELSPDLKLPELLPQPAVPPLNALTNFFLSLNGNRMRPLLLFDNFHIPFRDIKPEEVELMSQWKNHASFLICTERLLKEVNSRASQIFGEFGFAELKGLTTMEARLLLEKPTEAAGARFPEGDIQLTLKLVGNHPSLLILGGMTLWNLRKQLGLLEKGFPLDEAQSSIFQQNLEYACQRRFQRYLDALQEPETIYLEELASGIAGTVDAKITTQLTAYGLIYLDVDGRYHLFSALFRKYMQERGGSELPGDLTENESSVFQYLMKNRDKDCEYAEIWGAVWDEPLPEKEAVKSRVQVVVSRLKPKLPEHIQIMSVRGHGYRLIRQSEPVSQG